MSAADGGGADFGHAVSQEVPGNQISSQLGYDIQVSRGCEGR